MFFDWLTWGIWSIGILILILWLKETIREFKILFSEQSEIKSEDN
jgi:hypothetical protein